MQTEKSLNEGYGGNKQATHYKTACKDLATDSFKCLEKNLGDKSKCQGMLVL